jgi:hypothetical protein
MMAVLPGSRSGAAAQRIGNRLASNRGVHGVSVVSVVNRERLYNLPARAAKAPARGNSAKVSRIATGIGAFCNQYEPRLQKGLRR